jgi:ribosomal small subunit protein bTHX
MGKGDQRSKRGKIHVGTHGVTRLRKKKSAKKAATKATTVKKAAPKKAAKKAAK